MSEATVKERIIEFIGYKNISVNSFERNSGLSVGYLRQLRKEPSREKIKSIILAYPELNENWLLTGEGRMLNDDNKGQEIKSYTKNDHPNVMVPLVHIDSVGGVYSNNEIIASEQYIEGFVPFPDARPDDRAIFQSGDSMSPTIPPGSILQIRKVEDWREYLGYGNVYVLWLKDNRRITKLVKKYAPDPRNYVLCCSYNPNADEEELPRGFIVEVWKVVNVLINNGW